jgi:hypothetical protein
MSAASLPASAPFPGPPHRLLARIAPAKPIDPMTPSLITVITPHAARRFQESLKPHVDRPSLARLAADRRLVAVFQLL